MLGLVEALLSGRPIDDLADVLAGLRTSELVLGLAALASAAGPEADLVMLSGETDR